VDGSVSTDVETVPLACAVCAVRSRGTQLPTLPVFCWLSTLLVSTSRSQELLRVSLGAKMKLPGAAVPVTPSPSMMIDANAA